MKAMAKTCACRKAIDSNSHEALVKACESFMDDWRDLKSDYENTPLGHTAKAMESALALAKGKV